jgi:thymidylate kinase
MSRITIVCLEGCHGSGKTKIVSSLKAAGHEVLDENFINMPSLGLRPQSFTMELIWVSRWIERALELKKNQGCNDSVYYADRSPYSAILYAEWGVLLKPIIQQNLIDLKRAGIDIINVYVDVNTEVLWRRISSRLENEPERLAYNENSREHMTKVLEFYKSHDDLWHHTVDNTADDISQVVQSIHEIIVSHPKSNITLQTSN